MRSLYCLLLLIVCSCSIGLTREEQASLAARGYYTHLIKGEYELFLEGRAGADSLPADYRQQLLSGYKQFMAEQNAEHQGIREVQVARAVTDSLSDDTYVFLFLCYGDSTREEIVVSMIEGDKGWRMR